MRQIFGGALFIGATLFIYKFDNSKKNILYRIQKLHESKGNSSDALREGAVRIIQAEWPGRVVAQPQTDLIQLVAVVSDGSANSSRVIGFVQVGPSKTISKDMIEKFVRLKMPERVIKNKMRLAGLDLSILERLDEVDESEIFRCNTYLGPLVVDPAFRRLGIATALLASTVGESQRKFKTTSIYGLCLEHLRTFYGKVGATLMHKGETRGPTQMTRAIDKSAVQLARKHLRAKNLQNGSDFLPECTATC